MFYLTLPADSLASLLKNPLFASESRFSMSDMWDWCIFFSSICDAVWTFTASCDVTVRGHRCVYQECLSRERKGLQISEAWKTACEMWPQCDPALDIKRLWVTGGSVNKAVSRQFKPFKLLISQQHPPNNQFSTVSASLIFLVWAVSGGKATLITLQKQLDWFWGKSCIFWHFLFFGRCLVCFFFISKIVQLLHF